MTNKQRDAWYFDIMWSRIHDANAKGQDVTNFILGKKIETTARLGALAYGKLLDDYHDYLSAVLRARFEELAGGTSLSIEERKENYFALILKIIEERISRHQDPDVFATMIDFLFNAPHAGIDLDELGNWAFLEPQGTSRELLASILKARFRELITGELESLVAITDTVAEERQELSLHQQAYLMTTLKELSDKKLISEKLYALLTKEGYETLRGVYYLHKSTLRYLDSDDIGEIASIFDRRNIPWSCVALPSAPATNTVAGENTFPRMRSGAIGIIIQDFTKGSSQHDFLSASIADLVKDCKINLVTSEKLLAQGITTGLELFKTNPLWLMGYLDQEELEQIHDLFVTNGLLVNPPEFTEAQKKFLGNTLKDIDISVRCEGAIKSYNAGRPVQEQFLTANDIYRVGPKKFLELRNVGKKQIREISELFANHGLSWS